MRKKDFKRELISPNYRIDNNVMRWKIHSK